MLTILGVTIFYDLSWRAHANKVRAKLNRCLYVMRHFRAIVNFQIRLQLFNAFIKPVLTYCLPVWGNCPCTCIKDFDRSIIYCVRYILNDILVTISNVLCVFKIIKSAAFDKFSAFV